MKVSVIMPVLGEEAVVNDAIGRIRAMDEAVEIIVVDGGVRGETLKAVDGDHARLMPSGKGRARQMNLGAGAAQGDILLFLHADTELPREAFRSISSLMEEGSLVGGAFDLGINAKGLSFRLIAWAASLRSRVTRIPYGDQAIFLRRDYFQKIGGYREMPLMEDVDLMRRVKVARGKIRIIHAKVITSARRWKREGVLRCTLRNRTIMLLYLFGVSPERLTRWYTF